MHQADINENGQGIQGQMTHNKAKLLNKLAQIHYQHIYIYISKFHNEAALQGSKGMPHLSQDAPPFVSCKPQ